MNAIDGIGGIKSNSDEPIQRIGINDKKKKFPDELLQAGLSGVPMNVAYMPSGGIGSLLNGGKGSSQAATQV